MAAELNDEEAPPPGFLAGRFVEVHGVDWAVDAYDCTLSPIGELVEPEGKRGVARWDHVAEEYYVETIDGLVLPARHGELRAVGHLGGEAGGCDLTWPTVSMSRAGPTFALRVAEKLRAQGFCVLGMPPDTKKQSEVKGQLGTRTDWSLPHEEFEELFLGKDHSCKVAWLAGAEPPHDLSSEPLGTYNRRLEDLLASLLQWTEGLLGFRASELPAFPLLRAAAAGTPVPSPGSVAQAGTAADGAAGGGAAADGHVERVLDFVQRRKLCLMYFLTSGGGLELLPLSQSGASTPPSPALEMVSRADRLLIFRHDLFTYCWVGTNHSLALQTWLLEEPVLLQVEGIEGSQRRLEKLLGGPVLPPEKQVHVMNCHCRYPGNGYGLSKDWLVYTSQSDTFVEIPIGRFDVMAYYDDGTGGQFNASGKTSTKHCGLLGDVELVEFDNQLFNLEGREALMIPPIQRLYLEISWEMLLGGGFTAQTLRGANIYFCIADIGIEWDTHFGYHWDPHAWLAQGMPTNHSVNRLMHTFGVVGPCHQVDTACSASLVASNLCHAYLRKRDVKDTNQSMSIGGQQIILPWPFIGLSAAGMLGGGGRCKTFDQSANGYNRGEGCGGLFCRVSDDVDVTMERLACYCSSYINQDGRSASLTAPNGPSQQSVVRGSLGQGEISPDWVTCTENHGTGTALGDPIETGTIKSVFRKRTTLLPVTSGKSHMGHLECGAGSVGILKTIASIVHGGVPANCHLRMPNAHCDTDGFPGMFPVELCDIGTEIHYGGCNGFGFGGTNTRADFWAVRRNTVHTYENARRELVITKSRAWGVEHRGIQPLLPRIDKLDFITVPCARCLGPMCWLCGLVPPQSAPSEKHRCRDVREESASYLHCSRCYEGGYICGGDGESQLNKNTPVSQEVHLFGSWNAWAAPTELEPSPAGPGGDAWECEVVLGDSLQEQFCVLVQRGAKSSRQFIHPVARRAGQRVRPTGPVDKNPPGQYWLIDGHVDGVTEGAVYRVRFEWSDYRMEVSWRLVTAPITALPMMVPRKFQHQYYMSNSLSGWVPVVGTHDPDDVNQWLWFNSYLPESGKVELLLLRDADQNQMIYPMASTVGSDNEESVPVVGPDAGGQGKRWLAWGKKGERLRIFFRMEDGDMKLSIETATMGRRTWRGSTRGTYYLTGSWDNWRPMAMTQDAVSPNIWRASFVVGVEGREEFQLLVNQNWNLRLYPASRGSAPGECAACGPDRKGNGKNWQVCAWPGALMEVTYDLCAEDYCKMVQCDPLANLLEEGFN